MRAAPLRLQLNAIAELLHLTSDTAGYAARSAKGRYRQLSYALSYLRDPVARACMESIVDRGGQGAGEMFRLLVEVADERPTAAEVTADEEQLLSWQNDVWAQLYSGAPEFFAKLSLFALRSTARDLVDAIGVSEEGREVLSAVVSGLPPMPPVWKTRTFAAHYGRPDFDKQNFLERLLPGPLRACREKFPQIEPPWLREVDSE
jgi:hypothetical protein